MRRIRGIPVSTPTRRADFNEENPRSSAYICNNPIPKVTEEDEGKILRVVGGKWGAEPIPEGEVSIADCTLDVSLNTSTYVMTVALKDKDGKVVTQDTVDFPLESVVVNGTEEDGIVTLTLQNGNKITFDISDLVDGLVSQTKHDQDIARLEAKIAAATVAEWDGSYTITGGDE